MDGTSLIGKTPSAGLLGRSRSFGAAGRRSSGRVVLFEDTFPGVAIDTNKWTKGASPIVTAGEAVLVEAGVVLGNIQQKVEVTADQILTFDLHVKYAGGGLSGLTLWLRSHETAAGYLVAFSGGNLTQIQVQFDRQGGSDTMSWNDTNDFVRNGTDDYTLRCQIRQQGNAYTFKIGSTEKAVVTDAGHVASTCWCYFIQGDIDFTAIDNVQITTI